MKPGFFIDRPVFSTVLSILIVIVGIIGLALLPVDQYPQITPPVVKISATYPGASALTVSQAVATPIEQELNGTPGMIYMQSSSSNSGSLNITVTFDVSADADLAAVEIQNRVKLAESRLPAEVIQNGITIEKQAPSQLMTLSLMSDDPKFDEIYLSNFATINVLDVLRRIPGVGRVSNIGSRYYGMQIWVYRAGCGCHLAYHGPGTFVYREGVRGYRGASKPGWLDRPDERRGPGIAGGFLLFYGEWDQWEERRYLGYLYVAGGERSGGRHEGERGDEGYQQELPGRLGV